MTEALYIDPALPFTLEQAQLSDLGQIHQLEKICFPLDAWPWLELAATMSLPGIVRYKAIWDDQLVGFIAADKERQKDIGWIATICVHPDYRGHGIGRTLLAVTEQSIRTPRVRLTVREANDRAIDLYERSGYHMIERWPRYYVGGAAGIVMEKMINA